MTTGGGGDVVSSFKSGPISLQPTLPAISSHNSPDRKPREWPLRVSIRPVRDAAGEWLLFSANATCSLVHTAAVDESSRAIPAVNVAVEGKQIIRVETTRTRRRAMLRHRPPTCWGRNLVLIMRAGVNYSGIVIVTPPSDIAISLVQGAGRPGNSSAAIGIVGSGSRIQFL